MDIAAHDRFSWSFSRLKGFEDCPRRYHELMVLKRFKEERTELLDWGDHVHDTFAFALRHSTPLPADLAQYQSWIDKVHRTAGRIFVESDCKWCINRNFQPTGYFDKDAWLRGQADVLRVDPPVALVVDWKTGKSDHADELQLILMALLVFIHHPEVLRVRADFVFLKKNNQQSIVVDRGEIPDKWAEILPRVELLREATKTNNFPPTPNRFCKSWCPVSTCQHHGKSYIS